MAQLRLPRLAFIGSTRTVLGPTRTVFGPTCALLGPARTVLGPTWALLGAARTDLSPARSRVRFGERAAGLAGRAPGLRRGGGLARPGSGEPAAGGSRRTERAGVEQPDAQQPARAGAAPTTGRRRPRLGLGLRPARTV